MDYDRVQKLIKLVEESGISGLKIEDESLKIEISKQLEPSVVNVPLPAASAPVASAPAPAPAQEPAPSTSAPQRDANLVADHISYGWNVLFSVKS